MYNLLFVVGSTGGHLYPALSIIPKTIEHNHKYIILAPENIKDKLLLLSNNLFFQKEFSFNKPASYKNILHNFRISANLLTNIDIVISFGSIYSLIPSVLAKIKKRNLVLMEQNALPGRTTRLLSRIADLTILPFEESIKYIKPKRFIIMLSPIREEILKIKENKENKCLLFFGGSLGSRTINQLAISFLEHIPLSTLSFIKKIIIVTGLKLFEEVKFIITQNLKRSKKIEYFKEFVNQEKSKILEFFINDIHIIVRDYEVDISRVYKDTFLIVCRAGGSTLSELLFLKKRALLIPYPHALDNHQLYNAQIAKMYANFVDYLTEPVDINNFLEKLTEISKIVPTHLKEIRFFDYDLFFHEIDNLKT